MKRRFEKIVTAQTVRTKTRTGLAQTFDCLACRKM